MLAGLVIQPVDGGYVPVFMDALDSDEQELLESIPEDTELQLMEQIQLFSIRERRILKAINKYREQKGEVAVMDVNRSESKRSFKDQEEEAEYRYALCQSNKLRYI